MSPAASGAVGRPTVATGGAKREWSGSFTPTAKGTPRARALVVRARRDGNVTELRRIPLEVR